MQIGQVSVREQITKACIANGVPEFANEISAKWNRRFTAKAGMAQAGSLNLITLSVQLWERASDAENIETVIHETCHLIARKISTYTISSHGPEWQACMMRAGYPNPRRCHSIDRTGLARKNSRTYAYCRCIEPLKISTNIATRMQKGASYNCKRCRTRISLQKVN